MSRIRTYVVGRQQDCDLRLDDSTVSRRHAEVILTHDRYYLTDCNSAGGTYIHEGAGWRQIRQEFVSAGARLRFGHCEITAARFEALRARGVAPISGPARGGGSTPAELTAPKSEPGPDPRRGLRRDTITGEIIEQRGGEHG